MVNTVRDWGTWSNQSINIDRCHGHILLIIVVHVINYVILQLFLQ